MNQIKRKLRSRRGASITFALLIFLVCAVVSVAVVVAGSAAAGRMSQRAETDQRYYAVTSAAELLCDDFKGKTVTVVYDQGSEGAAEVTAEVTEIRKADNSLVSMDDERIVAAVSKTLVETIANPDTSLMAGDIYRLTAPVDGLPNAALDCTIIEYIYRDGRVVFEISNTTDPADTSAPVYTLQATFEANISKSVSQYEDTSSSEPTVKQKVTTKLVWSLNNIKKGSVGTL